MSEAWKKLDLAGEGLQTVNARLTRAMKRHGVAYGLCVLFPLGAHRFYLHSPLGAAAYLALSAAAIGVALTVGWSWALIPVTLSLTYLAADLIWIDRRVVAYNKALRMQSYLRPGNQPPQHYRGRYTDDSELDEYLQEKAGERAGHQPVDMETLEREGYGGKKHIPSFAEQEAMLRELAKAKKRPEKD